MMGYHIEASRSGFPEFKELPDRILVREDGWLGAYKFDGEPIVDYWYVPEQRVDELRAEVEYNRQTSRSRLERIDQLKDENDKLRELLSSYWKAVHCPVTPTIPRDYLAEMRKLGIEVPDA